MTFDKWRTRGAVLAVLVCSAAAYAETPLNLLFFGNSFTQGGSSRYVPDAVQAFADADGYATPVAVADLAGGTDLDYHYGEVRARPGNNVTNGALPTGDTWDFVILQGYSTEATDKYGDDTFDTDARTLYQAVANHSSGAGAGVTGVLYQTWARGDKTNSTSYTMDDMTADIAEGYSDARSLIEATAGGSCRIGTVGEAFKAANYSSWLYDSQEYHLRREGYTLAALILYRTIYGETVGDIAFGDVTDFLGSSVSSDEWTQLTAWADAAPIVVPEPASMSLLALGGLALLKRRRRTA